MASCLYILLFVGLLDCASCANLPLQPEYVQNSASEVFKGEERSFQDQLNCLACKTAVTGGMALWKTGISRDTFKNIAYHICVVFSGWGRGECEGFIDQHIDILIYVMDHKKDLTSARVCYIRLWGNRCVDDNYQPWSVNLAPKNPPAPKVGLEVHDAFVRPSGGEQNIVVHLTDIHYSPLYKPGSVPCGGDEKPKNPDDGLGYWGDYRCDQPLHSIVDVMQQIKKQHPKIDWVYFTGDLVMHGTSSREGNIKATQTIMQLLKDTFGNVPVFPALGNHESHPSDIYAPESVVEDNLSSRWLFESVATEWSRWLPNDTISTIRRGGYYSVVVKPGLRVVVLNNNYCYIPNLWLIYDDVDPYGQLQWLADLLAESERNQESVHILGHIQTDDYECWKTLIHEYRRIIERFSNTVTAQFNGHTHYDELKVFYSTTNPEKAVNVGYIGGSVTTSLNLNPNYRVYAVDRGNFHVTDYEQWMYDLVEANKHPDQNPHWFKLYSMKAAYGMNGLEPEDFHDLLQRMAKNITLVKQYRKFRVRNSPVFMADNCDKQCLTDLYCSITKIESKDSIHCKDLEGFSV